MLTWIKDNIGTNNPIHFSRFFPYYKLKHIPPTMQESLVRARNLALKMNFKYVYIGNIQIEGTKDTNCPKCGETMVKRTTFSAIENNLNKNKCNKCKAKVDGVWE